MLCYSVRGRGLELVGGDRESRKDTISQLSTPARFSSVSRKGFHTWWMEDGIKFLHCYPSVSLHQRRQSYPLQGLKLAHAFKEKHSALQSLYSTCAHFSAFTLLIWCHYLDELFCFALQWMNQTGDLWLQFMPVCNHKNTLHKNSISSCDDKEESFFTYICMWMFHNL